MWTNYKEKIDYFLEAAQGKWQTDKWERGESKETFLGRM